MIAIMITTLCTSVLVICVVALVGCIIFGIKNEVTFKNDMIICNAIYAYLSHLIEEGQYDPENRPVTFEDMEDYDTTLYRIWDWGYTRILPPEKFELIKPYIKAVKNND